MPASTSAGSVTASNGHAAVFPEPPDTPKGQVRVRSLGVVDLRPHGERQRIPALHIRVNIENTNASTLWTLAIAEQSVTFPNHAEVHPTYANSSSSTLPNMEIKPGETHAVDLYFALPNTNTAPKDLPDFDMKWQMHAGSQALTGSIVFERAVQPTPPPNYVERYPVGAGPYWWDTWSAPPVFMAPSIRVRGP